MDHLISSAISLLCIAVVVAIVARRLKLPYTIGLVFTGAALAWLRVRTGLVLTHDLIFEVVLPPLLFEAALSIHADELRRDALPITVLSTIGVMISAGFVSAGMMFVFGWSMPPALIFGVLIAATDPIAVIAMFKDLGIGGRVRLLVESESLFNDGMAAVLFALCLSWVQSGASLGLGPSLLTLGSMAGGGAVCGLLCGAGAVVLMGRIDDYLVETTVTTVTAYGAFILAEHLHFSGVVSTVAAGLLVGNLGALTDHRLGSMSTLGREFVVSFWEFAAFIANSFVFLLIGVALADMQFGSIGWPMLIGVILLTLVARALTVYPLAMLFTGSRWAIPIGQQHILWWGGLRGALALALALALPQEIPHHNEILILAFAVVAFSVIVQGLSMPWLLRRTGLRS